MSNKDFFDMSPKQSMVMGLLGGVAVISVVGFFIMLGSGGLSLGSSSDSSSNKAGNVASAGNTPPPAPPTAGNASALSPVTDKDHIRGNPDAKVTMIEFSDFECPFCQRHLPTLNQVLEQYDGDVRLVYRHFPLTSIHPNAQKAAEASECAGDQGQFWEMHDLLFANAKALTVPSLKSYAGQLGLNQSSFDSCLDSGQFASLVQKQTQEGQAAGVTGTPGTFVNGQLVKGAYPVATFTQIIDAALAAL